MLLYRFMLPKQISKKKMISYYSFPSSLFLIVIFIFVIAVAFDSLKYTVIDNIHLRMKKISEEKHKGKLNTNCVVVWLACLNTHQARFVAKYFFKFIFRKKIKYFIYFVFDFSVFFKFVPAWPTYIIFSKPKNTVL